MKIDPTEVARIAALAHLEIEPGEVQRMAEDMEAILGHADRLDAGGATDGAVGPRAPEGADEEHTPEGAVPSDGVGGVRRPGGARPDELGAAPETWAPKWEEGFFVVPPPPGVQAGDGGGVS